MALSQTVDLIDFLEYSLEQERETYIFAVNFDNKKTPTMRCFFIVFLPAKGITGKDRN
jgi:hypothetical protein